MNVPMIDIIGEGRMQANEAIHGILRFMKHEGPEHFDTEYLESLFKFVENGKDLTYKQVASVNRIISAYNINDVISWAHN